MFMKSTIAAGLFALSALYSATPAKADSFGLTIRVHGPQIEYRNWEGENWRRTLSPQQVRWILRDQGFRAIRFIDRDGRIYTANAQDYRGRSVVVRVNSRNGNIIGVQRVGGRDQPRCWLPEGCY